jgi:hypothetical protein
MSSADLTVERLDQNEAPDGYGNLRGLCQWNTGAPGRGATAGIESFSERAAVPSLAPVGGFHLSDGPNVLRDRLVEHGVDGEDAEARSSLPARKVTPIP